MNPNVRRYEYRRLCTGDNSSWLYPVCDTHQSDTEVAMFTTENEAQAFCDKANTLVVQQAYHENPQGGYQPPANIAQALIATPETDAQLRVTYVCAGEEAFRKGRALDECPVNGMLRGWWQEGWRKAEGQSGDDVQHWPL